MTMPRPPLSMVARLFAALVLFGCEGDEPETAPDLAPFIGTWTINGGEAKVNCANTELPVDQQLQGSVTISRAAAAHLEVRFSDPALSGCLLYMDVRDAVAFARSGTVCPLAISIFQGDISVESGTIQIIDGSARIMINGTVAGVVGGGLQITGCNGSFTSQLVKQTPDGGVAMDSSTTGP